MTQFAAMVAAFVIGTSACSSAPPKPIANWPSWLDLGSYTPSRPKSLSEIPSAVRVKLMTHLRSRLGSFVNRLTFSGGQVIDFKRLAAEEPDSKNYQWEVPAYILHFSFKMPKVGIKSYTAEISLRSNGSVLTEIDLPDFVDHPYKLHFVPLAKIECTAASRGFQLVRNNPELVYVKGVDAIAWRFSRIISRDGPLTQLKYIDISAHTGRVIKAFTGTSIR